MGRSSFLILALVLGYAASQGITLDFSIKGLNFFGSAALQAGLSRMFNLETALDPVSAKCGLSTCYVLSNMTISEGLGCDVYAVQTVPVGVLINASSCQSRSSVVLSWEVRRQSVSGPISCSGSISLPPFRAPSIHVYVAALSSHPPLRVDRVEVVSLNLTLPAFSCFPSAPSSMPIASVIAKNIPLVLDPLLQSVLPPPSWVPPEAPSLSFNATIAFRPPVTQSSLSLPLNGLFRPISSPFPPSFAGPCATAPLPPSPGRMVLLRLRDCLFRSLSASLFLADSLRDSFSFSFAGFSLQISARALSPPLPIFLASSPSILNTSISLEFSALGSNQGDIEISLSLPFNMRYVSSSFSASIASVNVSSLSLQLDVRGFRLPIDPTLIEPLVRTLLQDSLLPRIDAFLSTGVTFPVIDGFRLAPGGNLTTFAGFVDLDTDLST